MTTGKVHKFRAQPAVQQPQSAALPTAEIFPKAKVFYFVGREFAPHSGELTLHYRLEPGPQLTERYRFPLPPPGTRPPPPDAFAAALDLVHWLAGVSYWKSAIPGRWHFAGKRPDDAQLALLDDVYRHGLAEFAHRNALELPAIEVTGLAPAPAVPSRPEAPLAAQAITAFGGGKDSFVAVEQIRRLGIAQSLAIVGSPELAQRAAARTGLPVLTVERRLAPELAALNAAGAYNGHVPITAIHSAVLTVLALLHDCRFVVFANERSADSATLVTRDGTAVNHQWSKSLAFERAFAAYLERHVGGVEYFSLLRPWHEVAVCRQFAALEQYHAHFSSCNRHFHLAGSRIAGRWCGVCAKCRFVFLGLAPFLPRPALEAIFGCNPLAEAEAVTPYRHLLGLAGERPFECIGTVDECRAALAALAGRDEWRAAAVVAALAAEMPASPPLASFLTATGEHRVPHEFRDALD